MNSLVMCDYDGVIVDSFAVFSTVFLQSLHQCGITQIETQADLLQLLDGNFYAALTDLGVAEATIDKVLQTFQTAVAPHLDQIALFSGVPAALEAICRHNTVVVITSNLSQVVAKVFAQNGVDCVEQILGAEHEKSKVRKIEQTRRRYPTSPAYYVGDTVGDIIEGRRAGVRTVAVTWGWHSTEKLKAAGPDYMVSNREELTRLFV